LLQGARELGLGLLGGVAGLVEKPVEGARLEGAVGLVKGLGQGLAGAVAKPVVGVASALARTSEGVRNSAFLLDFTGAAADLAGQRRRARLPRAFAPDGVLRPYNAAEALARLLLARLDSGRHAGEPVRHFLRTTATCFLLLTDRSLLLLDSGPPGSPPENARLLRASLSPLIVSPFFPPRPAAFLTNSMQLLHKTPEGLQIHLQTEFGSRSTSNDRLLIPCDSERTQALLEVLHDTMKYAYRLHSSSSLPRPAVDRL
jgi:hypothetical protein